MPNPNAVVAMVTGIDPPLDRPVADLLRGEAGVEVVLEGDRRVRLDPDDPRSAGYAQVLDGLRRQGRPVYMEVDPETSAIAQLRIPLVTRVRALRATGDDAVAVEVDWSHVRHRLLRSSPDFETLQGALSDAMESGSVVAITETDAHEIIDVAAFTPPPEGPDLPFPATRPGRPPPSTWSDRLAGILGAVRRWLPGMARPSCISMAKAKEVFDAMTVTSCAPLAVADPCIPFLYPDNGCWARAHEMCRLMLEMKLKPRKVWIHGVLDVKTSNTPACSVLWGWHVAPTLCVRMPNPLRTRTVVIDPSLCTGPVSRSTWKGLQGDPDATFTNTDADMYYLDWNQLDPNYTLTKQHLGWYRIDFELRVTQDGPPPYPCP